MGDKFYIKPIAHIKSDFKEKFGIPRQSGLVTSLTADIIFEPEFRNMDALRGLDGFSHIWLIWQFSKAAGHAWSPTVRPPRLGGNTRMGVFATRSPFRPNSLGLSCVKLNGIREDREFGPVITVAGADILDGTPIYDIKPYLPYADCHNDAVGGFTAGYGDYQLNVKIPDGELEKIPESKRHALMGILAEDPRPSYQDDSQRVYGMNFAGFEIKFSVSERELTVLAIENTTQQPQRRNS